MDSTQRLLAIEELKKLKARYFRAFDTKDIPLLRSVFTEDVILEYAVAETGSETGSEQTDKVPTTLNGVERIIDTYNAAYNSEEARVATVHHGHMPEIEVTSDTTATGIWAMADIVRYPDPAKGQDYDGYGHYHETYVKVHGDWKIKTMRLSRLLLEFRKS